MRGIKTIMVLAVLAFVIVAGWRVGSDEVAYLQLQGDMHDLAAQAGNYLRYNPPRSDDQWRAAVIRKAVDHDIALEPDQVTVRQTESGTTSAVYLAADYRVPVKVLGFSFVMHFTPSSTKQAF